VINELVFFGGLDNTVKNHNAAEGCIMEDHQVLMFCPVFEIDLVDAKGLPKRIIKGFSE
jgi:hypothetical protein